VPKGESKRGFTRFPVVSLGAEHLVMGYLMRRNILTFKAPPNNEGYDLICMHPDPRAHGRRLRIQVKSRTATDCDRGFPVKRRSFDAFDYLIVVFLNVGYFFGKAKRHTAREGERPLEMYSFPRSFIVKHHDATTSWEKVLTRGLNIERYGGEGGLEQIARKLKIPYPEKRAQAVGE
jgi:hypothetical protein